MVVRHVTISVENPSKTYFAGQYVDDRVIIHNTKPIQVKQVTISLEGNGKVLWKGNPTTSSTKSMDFEADENYISDERILLGDMNHTHHTVTLPEGNNVYPFSFLLPPTLPSSFKSDIGEVSYFLYVEIRKPTLKHNDKIQIPINIIGIFDLASEPNASKPQECERRKSTGFDYLTCGSGQLSFILSLSHKSGFVPGEVIDFQAEIENDTKKKLKWAKASLQQVATFKAMGKGRTVRKIIDHVSGPGQDQMWKPDKLKVSENVPPTNLGWKCDCHLIELKYFLLFEVMLSGLNKSISEKFPIWIGTPAAGLPQGNIYESIGRPVPVNMSSFPMPPLPPTTVPHSQTHYHQQQQPYKEMGFRLPTPEIQSNSFNYRRESLPPYLTFPDNVSAARTRPPSANSVRIVTEIIPK